MRRYSVLLQGSLSYYAEVEVEANDEDAAAEAALAVAEWSSLPWRDENGDPYPGPLCRLEAMITVPSELKRNCLPVELAHAA